MGLATRTPAVACPARLDCGLPDGYALGMGTRKRDIEPDEKPIKIEVSFGKSSSVNYRTAVRLAKQVEGYEERGEGQQIRHSVRLDLSFDDDKAWDDVRQLSQIIGGWKSASFRLDGRRFTSMWELDQEIGEVRQCYIQRRDSVLGEAHCLGKEAPDDEADFFGCRYVRAITHEGASGYYSHQSQKWYQYGELSDERTTFRTDKEKILSLIKTHTADHLCTKCPCFSWDRVAREVSDLPEVIELNGDSHFEVKYSEINTNKALGIQPKGSSQGFGITIPIKIGDDEDDEDDVPVERNIPSVRYADIAAQDEALEEIRNIVELPLTHPEYFLEMGIEPQQGIILHGSPGNGKTLIAKAVATESKAHLEVINGPEVKSKWVGESEKNLRKAFNRARKLQPSIILIDELDAVAPRRDKMDQQHDVSLISQFLVLLDGLESRGRVAVIGTTNRIEAIDSALRRPGRFDYHIRVAEPDNKGRLAILKVHLGRMKTADGIDLAAFVQNLDGFSGAEIAGLCREVGLVSIRDALKAGKPASEVMVTQADLLTGLERMRTKRVADQDDVNHDM